MKLVDIAKRLRISHSTVSRALNPRKQHLISEEVRQKIFRLVDEFHFVPRRPLTKYKRTIGIILPTVFHSVFFNEQLVKVLEGVYEILKKSLRYDCKILIFPKEGGVANLSREDFTDDIEGLLISSQCDHFASQAHYLPMRLLQMWGRPVVVLNLEIRRGKNVSNVSFSNFDAAKKAVTHLIQRKNRQIALIYGDKDFEDSLGRYEGYLQTLREHSIPINKAFIKQGNYSHESGYEATVQLFNQKGPRPTAIFCTNDEMAIGAIWALEALQIRCPQEVAVMGFDGLMLGDFIRPRLSTVTQPLVEIAREGTQLLIDLIENRVKGPETKLVPSHLIIRESA